MHLIFWVSGAAMVTLLMWLRVRHTAKREHQALRERMGIERRWSAIVPPDDDELLLDPTVPLPPRRSLVPLVGDTWDRSARGERLRTTLVAADLQLKPSEAVGLMVLTALGSFIVAELLLQQGPIVDGIVALMCGVALPWLVLRGRRNRRAEMLAKQLPAVAELMSNALRAGLSLQSALELVARDMDEPAREEFELVIRELRLGGNLDDALEGLLRRAPGGDLEIIVTTLRVQRLAGGNLVQNMAALGRTLTERQRTQEEVVTMMAQSRFSSYLMPLLSLAALALMNRSIPGFIDVLFRTPLGMVVLVLFVGLQIGGFLLIQRLARINV